MSGDFDDLVGGEGLSREEEDRLRRVHDLLVEAGPPPDLPPRLETFAADVAVADADTCSSRSCRAAGSRRPSCSRRRSRPRRSSPVTRSATAGTGVVLGLRGGDARPERRDRRDPCRRRTRRQLADALQGLRAAAAGEAGAYYELWLTQHGKAVHRAAGSASTRRRRRVTFRVPYKAKNFAGWVVTAQPPEPPRARARSSSPPSAREAARRGTLEARERGVHYAWVVAAVGFVTLITAAGFRSTRRRADRAAPGRVRLEPRARSRFAISVNLIFYGLGGPFAAGFVERFGMRRVTVGALLGEAPASADRAHARAVAARLLWGVVIGLATGAVAVPLAAMIANRWFVERRGLVDRRTDGVATPPATCVPAGARGDRRRVRLALRRGRGRVVAFARGPAARRAAPARPPGRPRARAVRGARLVPAPPPPATRSPPRRRAAARARRSRLLAARRQLLHLRRCRRTASSART